MIGWNSVVHLDWIAVTIQQQHQNKERIHGEHTITLTWDAVEGGASFCQIEVNKRELSLLDSSLSISPPLIWFSSINLASCFAPLFSPSLLLVPHSIFCHNHRFPCKLFNFLFQCLFLLFQFLLHFPCPISAFLLFFPHFSCFSMTRSRLFLFNSSPLFMAFLKQFYTHHHFQRTPFVVLCCICCCCLTVLRPLRSVFSFGTRHRIVLLHQGRR